MWPFSFFNDGERAISKLGSLPAGFRTPALWQLLRYTYSPLNCLEEGASRYGDSFLVKFSMYGKFIILASPEAVRDVFRGDGQTLHSGESNQFLIPTVGPKSVLVLDEEAHARQRRIQLPPLKGERMRSFFDAMQSATLEAVRSWPVGQPVRMEQPMRRVTLRVILQAALGLPPGPQLEDLEQKVERLLAPSRTRFALLLVTVVPHWLLRDSRWLPYYSDLRLLDETLYALIDARRPAPAAERGECFLTDLLAATHEDGQPLSDVEIRDAVVTLLTAGHDTTSVALAWALEQIVPRPDVVQRITDEMRQITGGGLPRAEHLPRL